jgi:predicted MFS family arabinose efflux permease
VDRRKLLLAAMTIFSLANVVAASTHTFWGLAAARKLLACAAGMYTPNANALAGALVPPERRGRAIAIVNAGLTVAIAIGVPLGAVVGNRLGWRMTFVGVAVVSAAAVVGLLVGLPARAGAGMVTATLRERVRVVRQPRVVPTLLVTRRGTMVGRRGARSPGDQPSQRRLYPRAGRSRRSSANGESQ